MNKKIFITVFSVFFAFISSSCFFYPHSFEYYESGLPFINDFPKKKVSYKLYSDYFIDDLYCWISCRSTNYYPKKIRESTPFMLHMYGNEIQKIGKATKKIDDNLGDKVIELANQDNFNNADLQQPIREEIRKLYTNLNSNNLDKQITNEQNIDLPLWFSYQELCTKFIDSAISQASSNNGKLTEFVSTLRLRMNSFLNDKRMAIPLMLRDINIFNKEILPQFLSLLLGDYDKIFFKVDKNKIAKKEVDV